MEPLDVTCGFLLVYYRNFVPKIFDLTLKPGLRSLEVIGIDTDRSAAYDLLLTSNSNQGHTVSKINGDFCRKSQYFPIPVYSVPRWRGSPGNWLLALRIKKLVMWLRSPTSTDSRMDRLTPDDSNDRAYSKRRAVKTKPGIQRHLSVVTVLWNYIGSKRGKMFRISYNAVQCQMLQICVVELMMLMLFFSSSISAQFL